MAKTESNSLTIDFTDLAPLRDRIAASIRNAVIDGRLLPGSRLTEQDLVSMLGVSRTPLREALLMLDSEGFVNVLPRKGAVVSDITKEDVEEIYGAKSILETAAAKMACEKITFEAIEMLTELTNEMEAAINNERKDYRTLLNLNSEFHQLLSDAGGNKRISQFIRNLRSQTLRYNYIYLSHRSRIETSITDHRHMIEALKHRDKERIAVLIQDHNASACRSLCEFIQQHSLTNPNLGIHLE
jgi:DNA-binding GntR family transcriptional regulator